jgi:small subunit ribosomal protein S21e
MQNEQKKIVELYIPRKCNATNRLIGPKDHASVQIEIAQVDENGVNTGRTNMIALAGFMRQRGEADACLNRLFADMDLLTFKK